MKAPHIVVSLLFSFSILHGQGAYPGARHGGNYMYNFYFPPAPSTTPWAPAWSPDGKFIAVAMYGSIWKVDPGTGNASELTYNLKYHSSPDWSPDGKWIIYTADDDGKTIQLEILNVESGETHALTQDSSSYTDPVFSPDGSRVAYVSTRPNGYFNIFVRPIRDGRWTGDEVAITSDNDFGRSRLYFGRWDMHIEPAWMPDGKELLLVSNRGVPLGSGDVWRVPVQENGMQEGQVILSEQTLYRTRPHVSPDGTRFIYSSTSGAADQYNHLYVLPTRGGTPYKMTFGEFDHFHPRWSPDGKRIAFIANQGGLPRLWVMDSFGGGPREIRINNLQWKRPMGQLRVQVVDAATGKNTAARIYGQASDGKFYAPRDSYSRIGQQGRHVFHTEGTFTMTVPPGRMQVEAVKGFEYWPARAEVEIAAGKTAELRLELNRMTDMNAEGWYSGSTHVHMNYGGNLRNSLENLMMMSRAEDQDVVNELVANKDNRVLDWQYFVPGGGEHPVSREDVDMIVIVGEEYRPAFGGHVFLIGLRDHLISPFTTGYEGTAIESLYPINTHIFRKALEQGAATGYVHAFSGDQDPLQADLGVAKYFPVDAAFGTVHGLEWSAASRATLRVWHHALNNDFKITPTGGEDSISNLQRSKLVGSVRTYAFLGSNFSAEAWIEALKQGKTFFSSGPLLDFQVDGRIPGESVRLPAQGGTVTLEGEVQCIVPLSRVVIHRNGEVWKELPLTGDRRHVVFREKTQVSDSNWFSLYAEGELGSHPIDADYPQAATNAVRVYVGDQKIRSPASAQYFVRWMDKLTDMARDWFAWRSEEEKQHVLKQFEKARRIYAELAQFQSGRAE
ncbi:MAG: CehA/McbA family metallohydrolase [Acidobacteriota bacterium]